MGRTLLTHRLVAAAAASLLLTGCTTHTQETPSLSGPSGLGTSLTITVSPDTLTQDGASQSLVQVTAYDSNGQPLRNVSLRAAIALDGSVTDFGRLSAKSLVTDANGRASTTYTAPAPVAGVSTSVTVQILVTPSESDFSNATTRSVAIHLVPSGVIGLPTSPFTLDFIAPAPTVGVPAVFTATVSGTDTSSQVASVLWNFGDGATSTGLTAQHTFSQTGTFLVTAAVMDSLGRTASTSHSVVVTQGAAPAPIAIVSPAAPSVGQTVNFNASTTVIAPGRTATYSWDFGDGSTGSGVTTTHAYSAAGTYTVLLTVKLDTGAKGTTTTSVTVGTGAPTAGFTFSPSSPNAGQQVTFDASSSQATGGRSIVDYAWSFDDGSSGSGVTTTHVFTTSGTYKVALTITDSQGQKQTFTNPVTVGGGDATIVLFVVTDASGAVAHFDAQQTTAAPGRRLTNFTWLFGDNTSLSGAPGTTDPATGQRISTPVHQYPKAGSYNVLLTVTDDLGHQTSLSRPVTVQ